MSKHSNKAQIQITDLINESVEHAVARRHKAFESEGYEIDLSGEGNQDSSQIKGGGFQSIPKDKYPRLGLLAPSSEIQ